MGVNRRTSPYIGVTGIMSQHEARAVLDLYEAAWDAVGREPTHLLMLGVLASKKTLSGQANKYFNRYPKCDDIARCFVEHPLALNLLHFAGDFAATESVAEQCSAALNALYTAGVDCHGIQFNGQWPAISRYSLPPIVQRVVAQVRTLALSSKDRPGATDLLLDGSCGTGKPIVFTGDNDGAAYALRHSSWQRNIGIAGGLCAEHMPPRWLFDERPNLSIDAERRLRDDAEGGGRLDLAKVGAYFCVAVSLISQGR